MGRIMAALGALTVSSVTVVGTECHPFSPASVQEPPRPIFSARSELVVLHVMVKDRRGSYVTGLRPDAFTVLEDGRPQPLRFFGTQDAPVTIGLIVDSSGSMAAVRERVLAAATAFAGTSNPEDDIFALTFNERVADVLPARLPFTSDPLVLRRALGGAFVPRGRTALYDAVAAGLAYVAKGRHEGRVLVVVSDGGDNASTATFAAILRTTQISNTVIYTIALTDPLGAEVSPKRLKQLAKASGGEAFEPRNAAEIDEVLRHIARDIRNTYTIGYAPANTVPDHRLRRIRVLVRPPDRRAVRVRAREGYVLEP